MSWWSQRRRWLMRRATGAEGVSVTAAASLEAVRAALREPRRTLTELGDGGRQGEQSLTPAGAPGAPDGCHRLSKRAGDHELESVAFHVEQRCRERRLLANAEPRRRQCLSTIGDNGSLDKLLRVKPRQFA